MLATDNEDEDGEEEGGMSEDDMITFLEKGGLREVTPLTGETANLLGLEGRYEDDDGLDEIDRSTTTSTATGTPTLRTREREGTKTTRSSSMTACSRRSAGLDPQ